MDRYVDGSSIDAKGEPEQLTHFLESDEENSLTPLNPKATSIRPVRPPLRKGKWTSDEEIYANKIIFYFNQGFLSIAPGSTLRCLLSEKLNWYAINNLHVSLNQYFDQ